VDLGAGAGIWCELSAEYYVGSLPWTAVEAHAPYVDEFGLRDFYDTVLVRDLTQINFAAYPGHVFIFGDVLEHLDSWKAIVVIRRAAQFGTVVVMMPFLPSISAEQDAVNGVEWERHRYVWEWDEWLDALRTIGLTPEIVQAPPGDKRNKGVTICWHPSHTHWRYWEERQDMRYYQTVRRWIEELSPGAAILDVGSWDTPVATWGTFDRRYTCDLTVDPGLPGVTSHVGRFEDWAVPEHMTVATCLQTIEHLTDENVGAFTAKLLDSAQHVIVSVPYKWRAGEQSHHQDPIDEAKLTGLMHGNRPVRQEIVRDGRTSRLVAHFETFPVPDWDRE
jgi:hypothetical protein